MARQGWSGRARMGAAWQAGRGLLALGVDSWAWVGLARLSQEGSARIGP